MRPDGGIQRRKEEAGSRARSSRGSTVAVVVVVVVEVEEEAEGVQLSPGADAIA